MAENVTVQLARNAVVALRDSGTPPRLSTANHKRSIELLSAFVDQDGEAGMAWWNGMNDGDRSYWMKASLGTSPADAWSYYKRCGALDGSVTIGLLEAAADYISRRGHGENCYLSAHYEGDPGDQCNCGMESLHDAIQMFLEQPLRAENAGPSHSGVGARFHAPDIGTVVIVADNREALAAAAQVGCALDANLIEPVTVLGQRKSKQQRRAEIAARLPEPEDERD